MQAYSRIEEARDGIVLSNDPERIDATAVHAFLTRSYWSTGIPLETVIRSIENSLCFGLYDGAQQIGFARVVTDRATYARMQDVYVRDAYRGRGLGKWLVGVILSHPDLQNLKSITLGTRDAHELYRRFGFEEAGDTKTLMVKRNPDPFGLQSSSTEKP